MKKRVLITIIILAVSLLGVWYLLPQQPSELTPITFSPKWVNQAQFAGVFVAQEKGYYKKYGLDVSIKEFSFDSSVADDLMSGESQFGLMSANDVLTHYAAGKPVKAIAAFYQISPYALVSLKTLGVTSPIELHGKRLGIKGGIGAEGESIYTILLKSAGLNATQATFSYIPFGTPEHQDLIDEQVDVIGLYRTDQLFFFHKNRTPYNILEPERYGSAVYNDVLVATSDYLSEHPEIARSFIKATQKGWEYAYAHEREALEITQQYVTQELYKDPELEQFILEQSKPLMVVENIPIGHMDLDRWRIYYQTLLDMKLLSDPITLSDVISVEYLPR